MTFHPDQLDAFFRIYDAAGPRIRAFPGCLHLELLVSIDYPNVLTTLSHWESDEALQKYRSSDLFRSTWSRTKPLFAAEPEASSHEPLRGDVR